MILPTALGAACALALVAGCGGPKGSLDQLSVTQYRYNADEAGSIVRVLGVVRNTGEERTPVAEVVVTLVGRTGSMKGQNRVELPSLEGGAEHRFALGVTAHGRVDDVEITIVPRGQQPEGNAEAEAEGETAAPEGEGAAPANDTAPANADAAQSDAGAQEGD